MKKKRSACLKSVSARILGLVIPLVLLLLSPRSFAEPAAASDNPDVLHITASQQLAFADYYFAQGEFYRAIGEYNRFLYFFPQDSRADRAMFQIGFSYFQGQQYQDGIRALDRMIQRFPESRYISKAYFLISDCHVRLDQIGNALTTLHNLKMQSRDGDVTDQINYQIGWIHLEGGSWEKAQSYFDKITILNRDKYGLNSLKKEIAQGRQIKMKNPRLAGFLSLLPGMGYAYIGRYSDALAAFLINGGLGFAAYRAFDDDNPALGSLIAVVGAGFYGGNIFGSVSGAHKYNRNQTRRFIDQLKKTKINLLSGWEHTGVMLTYHYAF